MFELTPFGGMRLFAAYDPFREAEACDKRISDRQVPAFKTDIRETESAYLIEAELPGFSKEELSIEVKDGMLTVSAEHSTNEEEQKENGRYICRERRYTSFHRSFNLEGIRSADISASYQDGILTLTLPKETPQPSDARRIEII